MDSFETLNCSTDTNCSFNAVCYNSYCRCIFSFIWNNQSRSCEPITCKSNLDCYQLFPNSICNENECTCNFWFNLEPKSQECRFHGFLNLDSLIFFGTLIILVTILWTMIPGFVLLLKPKRKSKRSRLPIIANYGTMKNQHLNSEIQTSNSIKNEILSLNPFEEDLQENDQSYDDDCPPPPYLPCSSQKI